MNFCKKIKLITIFSLIFAGTVFAETVHVVKKGETLYSIGRQYQITVSELRAANNLSENDVLKAGQRLVVPSADLENAATLASSGVSQTKTSVKTEIHVVAKGETLYAIAKKYNAKVSELYSLNGMSSGDVLKVGQKIKVPAVSKPDSSDFEMTDPRNYSPTKNSGTVVWPVKTTAVNYVKGKVSGVRLSCQSKESVKCIREGTVVYTGIYRGFGEVVFVQSKTGLIYAYTGLNSVKVKKGAYVIMGDVLGKAGIDSITGKGGIMLMVIQNGEYIDPFKAPRG